jgi:hypothetical protein
MICPTCLGTPKRNCPVNGFKKGPSRYFSREVKSMNIEKYTAGHVYAVLYHNVRELKSSYDGPEHDPEKYKYNYDLVPDRGMSAYKYYKEITKPSRCYVYGRSDIKMIGSIVTTCPRELPPEQEDDFLRDCKVFYDNFLRQQGCDPDVNVLQATVHKDEAGQTHMHYVFVPRVENKKKHHHKQDYKICMNKVLTKAAYMELHDRLQREIGDKYGVNMYDHRTRDQGGNLTIKNLKERTREMERQQEIEKEREKEELMF